MRSKTNSKTSDIGRQMVGPLSEIKSCLEAARIVLVVSHLDPDGDALGTQLAFGRYLGELGKDVRMIRDSEIPDRYRFLPEAENIIPSDKLPDSYEPDVIVVLECPHLDRAGSAARFAQGKTTIINIDHHQDSEQFGNINWINAEASSVGEMAYEYFIEVGWEISTETACQLYTAILTDTGRFRYSATSPRTMAIAGDLIAHGANPRTICDAVYFQRKPSTMLLVGEVLASMQYFNNGRICLLTLTREMLKKTGADEAESDGLVDYTLHARGVNVGALLKEIDKNHTKISLRSCDGINVAEIAARLGGGGHFNAAGCVAGMPINEAQQMLIEMLGEVDGSTS